MQSQVVFITGAASGMGQLAAQRALAAGAKVAAMDVNAEGLAALGASASLLTLAVDIRDADAVRAAVTATEAQFGPIDRVMNAAAIMPLAPVLEQPPELVKRIMEINYLGLVHVAQATVPGMLARGRGEFVSFASLAGWIPAFYVGAYNASKFATVAFTEVLAQENRGRGVRFCCVCPPMVDTPLLDQARATVWPKIFSFTPPLSPDGVLDAIEKALRRGRFWVFPGPLTGVALWLRRFSSTLNWWLARKIEGRS